MDYAVSMLAAPAVGLASALGLQRQVNDEAMRLELGDLAAYCATEHDLCTLRDVSSTFVWGSLGVLALSILVPVLCTLAVRQLSGQRSVLALRFPLIVRTYLLLVVLVLAAQGCLVLFSAYELFISGTVRIGLVLLVIALLGLGIFSSAIAIASDIPRALTVEPVQVTGVVAEPNELSLAVRVARIAERLAAQPPDHLVVGLAPGIFATAATVRLRGEAELSDGVTLYVSAATLRVLAENELDALIACELGVLRGESVGFTRELVPMCASLMEVISFIEFDSERVGAVSQVARVPGNGFLAALASAVKRAQERMRRERASEADRAALQLIDAGILVTALTKSAALAQRWNVFRSAYEQYMLRGHTRRNLSADALLHLAKYLTTSDAAAVRTSLQAERLPNVFGGGGDSLAERAAQHGVNLDSVIATAMTRLAQPAPADDTLVSIEERLTLLENEYFHVPGRRVVLNTQEALPAELATV